MIENKGTTNYSRMSLEFGRLREDPYYRVPEVHYEQDITIYNQTKLKINIEGCVNTLSEECKHFYNTYGKSQNPPLLDIDGYDIPF